MFQTLQCYRESRMSKGSTQRPLKVSRKEFDDNFERIFNKGKDMAHKKPARGERMKTNKITEKKRKKVKK